MRLTNIYSYDRKLYLFIRDEEGKLHIKEDKSFFPYYYINHPEGNYKSYLGEDVYRTLISSPKDLYKLDKANTYEADVRFEKRYLIDKVDEIEETNVKYAFLDIEVLTKELPDVHETKYPVSCISIYNSYSKSIKCFYLGDYANETSMLDAFVSYLKVEQFDLILGWNIEQFDYPYLMHRIPDFAKRISPIGKQRFYSKGMMYPAGTSIVDYLLWYKRIFKGLGSYALDNVLNHEFGAGKEYNPDFSVLSEEVKLRNIDDVRGLEKIERKQGIINHYDWVRRIAKVEWEDLIWNSRTIDMLLLQEAKNNGIVLPSRVKDEESNEEFEGAFRETFETGAFYNLGKYDLAGAYLNAIIDLCLDTSNLTDTPTDDSLSVSITDRVSQDILTTHHVRQRKEAILPTVCRKLLLKKSEIKSELAGCKPTDPQYHNIQQKYDAFKGIILSSWGVIGNKYFRLYDHRIASLITATVRDLLHYIKASLDERGVKVIYIDTDSVFCEDGGVNIAEMLNELIQEWSQTRYNKPSSIVFEYEGHFKSILIIGMCRYIGYVQTNNGIKEEVKGVETKRVDSSAFMKTFQKALIKKILAKESKSIIDMWIEAQRKLMLDLPISEVAFPCRLSKAVEKYEKTTPIHVRAMEYSGLHKEVGDRFYYIYIVPTSYQVEHCELLDGKRLTDTRLNREFKKYYGYDLEADSIFNPTNDSSKLVNDLIANLASSGRLVNGELKISGKPNNVIAFDEDNLDILSKYEIDWDTMVQRNINSKADRIYEAMGWK